MADAKVRLFLLCLVRFVSDSSIEPSLDKQVFACPSCDQVGEQVWFNAYASPVNNPAGVPLRIQGEDLVRLANNPQFSPDVVEQKLAYWKRVNEGGVFLDRWAPVQSDILVAGLEISLCRACLASAIWLGGKLVCPPATDDASAD